MRLSAGKKKDVVYLVLWTLIVTVLQIYVLEPHAAYIPTLFYFVVPTVYLIFKYRPYRKAILAGTLLTGILIPLPFDLLIHLNESWFVPSDKLLIPFKLFGYYPVDEIIWFALLALYTLVFYEVFVDGGRKIKISNNFKTALYVWLSANVITLAAILVFTKHLLVPYSYFLIIAPLSLTPIIYVLWKKPHLVKKFILPTVFFFMVSLCFEIVGLTFGHWEFNDDYVGWISIFGRYFPFEELLFWMLLYPATIISYYELLVDNGK